MRKSDLIDGLANRPASTLGRLAGYHDLTALHDRWIKEAWDDPGPVGMPVFRGSFKTSAVVIIGIGDSITGTHADAVITDGILNISGRVSGAARKQTLTAFYELQNIIDPARDGAAPPKQIFNGTRRHGLS